MDSSSSCLRRSSSSAIAFSVVLLVATVFCLVLSSQKHLLWDRFLATRNDGASAFQFNKLHYSSSAARNTVDGKQSHPWNAKELHSFSQSAVDSQLAITSGNSSFFRHAVTYHFLLDLDGGILPAKLVGFGMEDDNTIQESEDFASKEISHDQPSTLGWIPKASFPLCPPEMQDFIPYREGFSGKPQDSEVNSHCMIATPAAYVRPFKWPQCQSQVRAANIPAVPLLRRVDAHNWRKLSGSLVLLSQGGPLLSSTADVYIGNIEKLAPSLRFGEKTRVVLDVTGGSGSLSVALEEKGVLTLTISAKESANNGIQLILERGQPGLVQDIATPCLPYPSQAFDLLHFASAEISWTENGGLVLYEADRLVRECGFLVFKKSTEKEKYVTELMRLGTRMCWDLIAEDNSAIIWQKHVNKACFSLRSQLLSQSYSLLSPQNITWNASLIDCHIEQVNHVKAVAESWPSRLTSPPQRLYDVPTAGIQKAKNEAYIADLNFWKAMISIYLRYFSKLRASEIRNVLDMNSGYGGFAAAIALKKPALSWWVLNVVLISGPDRLPVIFDRGLLGVYHDWCKALDTYPRSFDMLHASWLFSVNLRCSVSVVALEMDRLLRPGGFVLLRDKKEAILQFRPLTETLKWKTTILETENGPEGNDIFLHCQKTHRSRKSGKIRRGAN